jgi:hypothetical protein
MILGNPRQNNRKGPLDIDQRYSLVPVKDRPAPEKNTLAMQKPSIASVGFGSRIQAKVVIVSARD